MLTDLRPKSVTDVSSFSECHTVGRTPREVTLIRHWLNTIVLRRSSKKPINLSIFSNVNWNQGRNRDASVQILFKYAQYDIATPVAHTPAHTVWVHQTHNFTAP